MLFDKFFTNLDYNGGPVMPSNTNYAVYWDPPAAPAYPSDYQVGVADFGSFVQGENRDKCRTFNEAEFGTPLGTAPNGAKYNQVVNGHLYWYQQEWSNQGHTCLQRLTFNGVEPTATFTSKAGSGFVVKFDATRSTAPGGVSRYNWQFNDGPGNTPSKPEETTTATVSHKIHDERAPSSP